MGPSPSQNLRPHKLPKKRTIPDRIPKFWARVGHDGGEIVAIASPIGISFQRPLIKIAEEPLTLQDVPKNDGLPVPLGNDTGPSP